MICNWVLLRSGAVSLVKSLEDWFRGVFAARDEFGLSADESKRIIDLASRSGDGGFGYDCAMELAVSGHGLRFSEFDALLLQHGIGRK